MPNAQKHIAIICNPTADNGKAVQLSNCIAALLQRLGVSFSLFVAQWPPAWDGFTELWVVGGDGTVHYFINQHPDCKLPIAVFAGGTANDLHFALYGNMGVEAQVQKVLQARPQPVDAGLCNGRLFLNGVGIGFDGAIVHHLLGKKKRPGKASYLLSILQHIFSYRETAATLQWNGKIREQECFMIAVANGRRYGGGFTVAPLAAVHDGLLDLMVVGKIGSAGRIKYLPVIEKGEHLQLPFVQYDQTGSIVIQAAQPLPAHCDGEYFSASRFHISCLPHHFLFLL